MDAKLVTDPYDQVLLGMKFPKTDANVVTVSHQHADHNKKSEVDGNPLVVDMPGEYEKSGFRIFGYKSYHDKNKGADRGENTLFKIEAEGLSVLHCGDLGLVPDDSFIDSLGEVHVLMIPVGGYYTIDANEAVEVVKKIEPSIVIPMHYNQPKLNPKQFGVLAPVKDFLSGMGAEGLQPVQKLVIKREELGEEMKVVLMDISS